MKATIFTHSALLGVLLLAVLAGCRRGVSEPPRFGLSGRVTYDGKPVPAGFVAFSPDDSQGNRGPTVTADIHAGQYQIKPDEGTVGGPHRVSIHGLDGKPIPYGNLTNSLGKRLFPEFKTQVDLPCETATQDFTVPADKAR